MQADGAKKLKELEVENARLKKLLAEAELDKAMLKELAEGNGDPGSSPPRRCGAAGTVRGIAAQGLPGSGSASFHSTPPATSGPSRRCEAPCEAPPLCSASSSPGMA
jgi:hypothetical protein